MLLQSLLADIEGPCDSGVNETLFPPTNSSLPLFFSPRPLRPEEKRAPLLDLQWELEDPKPHLPLFHFQPMPHRAVASQRDKKSSVMRTPQPPIGTGRPRPRAVANNDASNQQLFRLRPLPPCPQPPIRPTCDLPPLPYGVLGKRVFSLPPKDDISTKSGED